MSTEALRGLILCLLALLAAPFALAWFLFTASRYEAEKARIRKARLPAALLNLVCGGAVLFGLAALIFHTRAPWRRLAELTRLKGAWEDMAGLTLLTAAGLAVALAGGLLLRRLFLKETRSPLSRRRRLAVLCLLLFAGCIQLAALDAVRKAPQALTLFEACRKTTVARVDPKGEEALGSGGRKIFFVTVENESPLDLTADLCLAEAGEEDAGLVFDRVLVPGGGQARLTRDAAHGLDLSKKSETPLSLRLKNGAVLDEATVPALAEDEIARRFSRAGETPGAQTALQKSGETADPAEPAWEILSPVSAVAPPVFSAGSGLYDEAFTLTLSAPEGCTILYTLDGSDPARHGQPYTEPLRVEDPSPSPNRWSARMDVSTAFEAGVTRFTVPEEPVDKCAVVRAVCVDESGAVSPVVTESYWIGYARRQGYTGLTLLSLAADEDDLFGEAEGIYVLGDVYRNQHPLNAPELDWWWWSANYHQRGRAWERQAALQALDAEGNLLLNQQVGVRVKGGASSAFLPKGLNLYARRLYDGNARFGADLFGTGFAAKRVSLSAGGNDVALKVKDWLTARLTAGLNITMTHYRPCCLFLNGEYWGNYWLCEQLDNLFFADTYGLAAENIAVVKNGQLKAGVEADKTDWDEMIARITSLDLREPGALDRVGELLDLDSFALCYAIETYTGNVDRKLEKNTAHWRVRVPEDGAAGDGRWRCALFDLNHTSCYRQGDADVLEEQLADDSLFRALMTSPDFCDRYYGWLQKLAREVFTPERAGEALDEYIALMEAPLTLEHTRFSRGTGLKGLNTIRAFFPERQAFITRLCEDYFADAGENGRGGTHGETARNSGKEGEAP